MTAGKNNNFILGLIAAALLIGANIAYVSFFTGFIHQPAVVLETDHYRYIEMARGPENYARSRLAHETPFCWRLLIPFIVFLLTGIGLNPDPAFYLVTNISLLGYLFVFFLYLKQAGQELKYALPGIILIALTPGAVRWYEYQYWMTDPAALFFVILAFYLIRAGKTASLLAVSVIAVTVRETYLAVPVYYFFFLLKRRNLKTAVKTSWPIILIPAVLLILIRHYIIPADSYHIINTIKEVVAFRLENFRRNQLCLFTLGSFGIIFPLLLLFPARIFQSCKEHYDELIFVSIIYISLAMGYNTDRLLAYTLPVILVAAMKNLKEFITTLKLPPLGVLALVIALQAFFYLSTRFYRLPAVSVFPAASVPVVIILSLFWLSAVGLLHHRGRSPVELE